MALNEGDPGWREGCGKKAAAGEIPRFSPRPKNAAFRIRQHLNSDPEDCGGGGGERRVPPAWRGVAAATNAAGESGALKRPDA